MSELESQLDRQSLLTEAAECTKKDAEARLASMQAEREKEAQALVASKGRETSARAMYVPRIAIRITIRAYSYAHL